MNYFVCIEATNYHLWQTELLIQSFRRLRLEDKLYIAICEKENNLNPEFMINTFNHKNKFHYKNAGGVKNKFYTMASMVNDGILKPPFATIHPDMLIVEPIEEPEADIVLSQFDVDQSFKNDPTVKKYISQYTNNDFFVILDPSAIYVVNENIDKNFIYELWNIANWANFKERWGEKAVWYLGIIKYLNTVNPKLRVDTKFYEQAMVNYELTQNFIHYNHGFPPSFHKYHHKFEPPECFCIDDNNPLRAMHSINPNKTTDFISGIIESYWKQFKFEFHKNVWEA